jgi:type II secretory pathway pseudopilin PulG
MHHRRPQSESGYILLAVLFMVVLILVALAVAAPRIATDIQRDREDELIHRGKQYTRAVKLYYKKFGRYPSSIDQLENTNNIRFLRKRYVDPMTGKDDWKIVHFGEAHVKAMGLFGQPFLNAGTAGSSVLGGTPGLASNPLGNTPSLGGTTSTSGISSSSPGSTGSDSSGTSGTTGTSATSGATGTSTAPGTSTSTSGSTSPFGSNTGTSAFGSGQTFGGAPMVGVVSKNTKASIKEYKQQKHYNEWEFVYDPVEDLMSSVSLVGGGQSNINGTGSTGTTGTPTNGLPGTTSPGTTSPYSSNPSSGSGTTGNPPASPQ